MKLQKVLIFEFDITNVDDPGKLRHLREQIERFANDRDVPHKSRIWEEPPPRICSNCGEPETDGTHWDDLDGPNRAGWACVRR